MSWLSALGAALSYITLPIRILGAWIISLFIVLIGPVVHLGDYIVSGLLLPIRLFAKLEVKGHRTALKRTLLNIWQTLYIYLGVAAILGLITGSILHISSSLLISLFNLTAIRDDSLRSAASIRATRQTTKLQDALQATAGSFGGDTLVEKKYAEWLGKDLGSRGGHHGLLRQTIIEEDDDSEDDS